MLSDVPVEESLTVWWEDDTGPNALSAEDWRYDRWRSAFVVLDNMPESGATLWWWYRLASR